MDGCLYNDSQHGKNDDHTHRGYNLQLQSQEGWVYKCTLLNSGENFSGSAQQCTLADCSSIKSDFKRAKQPA